WRGEDVRKGGVILQRERRPRRRQRQDRRREERGTVSHHDFVAEHPEVPDVRAQIIRWRTEERGVETGGERPRIEHCNRGVRDQCREVKPERRCPTYRSNQHWQGGGYAK